MAVTNGYCTSDEPAVGQVVGVLFDGNAPISFSAHAFEYLLMWMQPKKRLDLYPPITFLNVAQLIRSSNNKME